MLVLTGCAQPAAAPDINAAAARVLDRLGVSLSPWRTDAAALSRTTCRRRSAVASRCGATSMPGGRRSSGAQRPLVATASGCGAMICDYGTLLRDDPEYASKAARVCGADAGHQSGRRAGACERPRRCSQAQGGPAEAARGWHSIRPARCSTAWRSEASSSRCSSGRVHAHVRCGRSPLLRLCRQLLAPAAGDLPRSSKPTSWRRFRRMRPMSSRPRTSAACCISPRAPTVPVRHWIELLAQAIASSA